MDGQYHVRLPKFGHHVELRQRVSAAFSPPGQTFHSGGHATLQRNHVCDGCKSSSERTRAPFEHGTSKTAEDKAQDLRGQPHRRHLRSLMLAPLADFIFPAVSSLLQRSLSALLWHERLAAVAHFMTLQSAIPWQWNRRTDQAGKRRFAWLSRLCVIAELVSGIPLYAAADWVKRDCRLDGVPCFGHPRCPRCGGAYCT